MSKVTNKDLANLMYPHVTKTIDDYERIYPKRNLKEGAIVSRYAPSPTGFVHMGNMLACFIENKLPRETVSVSYSLEYGTNTLCMHKDAIKPGDKVVIIDDLMATGGTMGAIVKLVEKLGENCD